MGVLPPCSKTDASLFVKLSPIHPGMTTPFCGKVSHLFRAQSGE